MIRRTEQLIGGVARILVYLKEPDYLYDLHSSLFSLIFGSALLVWCVGHRQPLFWGFMIVGFGLLRIVALVVMSTRLHSASCLMSFIGWIFLVWIFLGKGLYAMALLLATFSITSLIRYMQIEWWKPGAGGGASADG